MLWMSMDEQRSILMVMVWVWVQIQRKMLCSGVKWAERYVFQTCPPSPNLILIKSWIRHRGRSLCECVDIDDRYECEASVAVGSSGSVR